MEHCLQLKEGCLRYGIMGNTVLLRLELPLKKDGLYKGFLVGRDGRLDLGTMMPQGRCLTLERRFSLDYLKIMGVFPPTDAGMVKSHGFGKRELPPSWKKGDRELLASVFEKFPEFLEEKNLVYREKGDGFLLASPYDGKRAFPLVRLFCLGELATLGGEGYVLYRFLSDGSVFLRDSGDL